MRWIALLALLATVAACNSGDSKARGAGAGSGSSTSKSAGSGSGSGSGSATSTGRVLDQADWIRLFVPTVIDAACGPPDTFFRSCFTVDEAGCRSELDADLHRCVADLRLAMPPTLDKPASEAFGGRIGECAGSAYELNLKTLGKRRSNAKCDDPKQW